VNRVAGICIYTPAVYGIRQQPRAFCLSEKLLNRSDRANLTAFLFCCENISRIMAKSDKKRLDRLGVKLVMEDVVKKIHQVEVLWFK
jgi:hypothetical protein